MVIEIELLHTDKPHIEIQSDVEMLECLIDTGASIPVWCKGIKEFKANFKYAQETMFTTVISGFGGKGSGISKIWKIPQLTLRDRNNRCKLQINNLFVAVLNKSNIGCPLILSGTVFKGVNYGFVNNANPAIMKIEFNRPIYVTPDFAKDGTDIFYSDPEVRKAIKCSRFLKGVSVLTQSQVDKLHKQRQIKGQGHISTQHNSPKLQYTHTCIAKIRNKDKYVAYQLKDRNGRIQTIPAKELKNRVMHKEVIVENLTLTKDNRLIGDNIPVIKS